MVTAGNPIYVALDVPTVDEASGIARAVGPWVGGLKIGMELFHAVGPAIFEHLDPAGVFLDLKLHDIPTTVRRTVATLSSHGAAVLNVHALGGRAMMEAANETKGETAIIAVTILTSLNDGALKEVGLPPAAEAVPMLAELARDAGCDGVVCAPTDIEAVRAVCPQPFLLVTPGVRPVGASADDQVRTMTPKAALAAGADRLVIGRPITATPDPAAAARAIAEEIA